jgi:hypothetical protein
MRVVGKLPGLAALLQSWSILLTVRGCVTYVSSNHDKLGHRNNHLLPATSKLLIFRTHQSIMELNATAWLMEKPVLAIGPLLGPYTRY